MVTTTVALVLFGLEVAVDLKVYGLGQLKKLPLIAKLVLFFNSLCTLLFLFSTLSDCEFLVDRYET